MRVVTYRRVSSREQADDGLSLDHQNQKMESYCAYQGWDIVSQFIDEGVSGSKTKRPGFVAAMEMVKRRQCDVVLVYSLSRFARNTMATLEAVESMKKSGVRFVSLHENIDTDSALGYFFLTVMASMAQLERDRVGEHVSDILEAKRGRGERIGGIPFGLKCVGGSWNQRKGRITGGVLVENEDEMDVVRRIIALREGDSHKLPLTFEFIAVVFNEEKVPNRGLGLWNRGMVQKIYKSYSTKE